MGSSNILLSSTGVYPQYIQYGDIRRSTIESGKVFKVFDLYENHLQDTVDCILYALSVN